MIRVLVIDVSVVARRLISAALDGAASIKVVATAPDGLIGLRKIDQIKPDLVLMDLDLSETEAFSTFHEIRARYTKLPVILFSSVENKVIMEAQARTLGYAEFVGKPDGAQHLDERKMLISSILVPKIYQHVPVREEPIRQTQATFAEAPKPSTNRVHRIDVVAIGVSTGGPAALAQLMPSFPRDLPVPIVIVQHMPPQFTSSLAKRLDIASKIPIYEGAKGDVLRPGAAWLAPGGFHMVVKKKRDGIYLDLNEDPPEEGCRPAVDVLFRSVADVYGPNSLAVILTGMGKDGLEGSRAILQSGGRLLAQDKESSVIWGMPGAVIKAGLPEKVSPLNQLGFEIISRVKSTQSLSLAHRI